MTFTKRFLLTFFLFVSIAFSQDVNCWKDEKCRQVSYTNDEWYSGFAEDELKRGANVAESRGNLEQSARARMVESIKVNIGAQSQSNTDYSSADDMLNTSFTRMTQTSANAEVVNTFIDSYHDKKANKIYAFAAVKKSDLADFYATQIEFSLSEAEREIQLAKQLLEQNKRKEVFEKLDKNKKAVDATNHYRTLLIAVDTQNGLARSQGERINKVLNEIMDVQAKTKAKADEMVVLIVGNSDIIVSGLQAILSENDVAITENEYEAVYVLKIDARICNQRFDGRFHYVNACVKASLVNVETGKNEAVINSDGEKGSGININKAAEDALNLAASDVWEKIKEKF